MKSETEIRKILKGLEKERDTYYKDQKTPTMEMMTVINTSINMLNWVLE